MFRSIVRRSVLAALVLATGVALGLPARQAAAAGFPSIKSWVLAGAYQDSSTITGQSGRCVGDFQPRPDSLRIVPRALSLRFLRDRRAEARPDFGGYRIYRMVAQDHFQTAPDTMTAMLIRRYSRNIGSERTWNLSTIDTSATSSTYMQYLCNGGVVHDSIVTFVDPDSNGNYVKVCRRQTPDGRCLSIGDSVMVLKAPPGPHDGFNTWYAITYESLNATALNFEDMLLPDTLDSFARCSDPSDRFTCPNLNSKLRNVAGPVQPTAGPTKNLETAHAVPNPWRNASDWLHFINLPSRSTIKIYTVAGDLVRTLEHSDTVRDYEEWDLKSGAGKDVASGIYMYRIESGSYSYQDRLIIIR